MIVYAVIGLGILIGLAHQFWPVFLVMGTIWLLFSLVARRRS